MSELIENKDKISVQVKLPADLKKEAQVWARVNDTTLTAMIIRGLKLVLKEKE